MTIDTEHRDAPICPWCGEVSERAVDMYKIGINRSACLNCREVFTTGRNVTITYTTEKL